jgi:hypothetical protein
MPPPGCRGRRRARRGPGWPAWKRVALGYLGDRAAIGVLDDAERHADASVSSEPVWPWVFEFDSSKIASYRAIATSRLGLPKIATEAFGLAETSARSPKQAAIVTTEQARALAACGQLEHACALALAAYDIGCGYDSERVRQAVRDFRASLGSRAPHRVIAELDERLHSAYTTRTS